ncbi:hypothetical protein [Caulobacter sp. UC70_42]|uniref:hypothetical protein n=1 Tax=Caulobacter sp. UC70_42 TaxID=3374551 RepID=UPI003757FE30
MKAPALLVVAFAVVPEGSCTALTLALTAAAPPAVTEPRIEEVVSWATTVVPVAAKASAMALAA